MPVLVARVAAYARFAEAVSEGHASDQVGIDQVFGLLHPELLFGAEGTIVGDGVGGGRRCARPPSR